MGTKRLFYKLHQFLVRKKFKIRQQRFEKNYSKGPNRTLICSNCLAGILYHDSQNEFLTPTINLTFEPNDFLTLCENLNGLSSSTIVQVDKDDCSYPVGDLYLNGKHLRVLFVHYSSFTEAQLAFARRTPRVKDDLTIVFTVRTLTEALSKRFDALPYDKKCLFFEIKDPGSWSESLPPENYLRISLYRKDKDALAFRSLFSSVLNIEKTGIDFYEALRLGTLRG